MRGTSHGVADAARIYNLDAWGRGYFTAEPGGRVAVHGPQGPVALPDIVARAREQGEETMANQLVDDLARMAGGEDALERAWRRCVRRLGAWERGIEATLPAARPEGPTAEKARDLVEALGAPDYTLRADATRCGSHAVWWRAIC